jgi:hypothetical protein
MTVETLTGRNMYALNVSNSVSMLYIDDDTIPKNIAKIMMMLIVGIFSKKI